MKDPREEKGSRRGVFLVAAAATSFIVALGALLAGFGPTFSTSSSSSLSTHHAPPSTSSWPDRRAALESRLRENPDDRAALRELAEGARKQGDAKLAAVYLRRLCSLEPKNAAAWRDHALAARDAGNSMEALISAHQALALKPDDAELSTLVAELASKPPDPLRNSMLPRAPDPLDFDPAGRRPR